MTVYFGIWKMNKNLQPPLDPKVQLQQNIAFQAMMRQDLVSGVIKEAHAFVETGSGYFITGDVSDEALHETLVKWFPYITFELHRTIPILKSFEDAISASRARASAVMIPA